MFKINSIPTKITFLLLCILCFINSKGQSTTKGQVKDTCLSGNCITGYGEKKRETKLYTDTYKGTFLNGLPQGTGVYSFRINNSEKEYSGYFFNGSLNGEGNYMMTNKEIYVGNFVKGMRNGFGRVYFSHGGYYEGTFKDDVYFGYGTYHDANGTEYTGFYLDPRDPLKRDMFNDKSFPNEYLYGYYVKKNIDGTVTIFHDIANNVCTKIKSDKIISQLVQEKEGIPKPSDLGQRYFIDNYTHRSIYPTNDYLNNLFFQIEKIDLVRDKLNGYADLEISVKPGSIRQMLGRYHGILLDNLFHGTGVLELTGFVKSHVSDEAIEWYKLKTWNEINYKYVGEFSAGSINGKGILFENGSIYVGDFVNGRKEGFGKFCIFYGDKYQGFYEGTFKNNLIKGEGTLQRNDGSIYIGSFNSSVIQSGMTRYDSSSIKNFFFEGFGILKYWKDSTYIGQWNSGWRHGMGKIINTTTGETIRTGLWRYDNFLKSVSEFTIEERKEYGLQE